MTAALAARPAEVLAGAAARARLAEAAASLAADDLVAYLGPGLIDGAPLPTTPEAVAAALHARAPAPSKIRTNMWSVAQFIEQRRHRRTLQGFMTEVFAAPLEPTDFHRFLAGLPLSLVVDTWYDGTFAAAFHAAGRGEAIELQGITRAGETRDIWTKAYDAAGAEVPLERADAAARVLYAPHGGVRPARNFLVSDADYVEALTEIDIQSPIPATVQRRRASRGFLFLGCRFHDQMLRTYARQIMKRSAGPHHAVVDAAGLSRNEALFLAAQGITPIDLPLADALAILMAP